MTDREKLVEMLETSTYEALGGNLVVKGIATAKQLADHLIANGVTVQNWRDAKTDPPPQDEDVLLRFANETMVVGGLREDGGWYAITDAEWYTDCETVPEKWQPLPEVPKEV